MSSVKRKQAISTSGRIGSAVKFLTFISLQPYPESSNLSSRTSAKLIYLVADVCYCWKNRNVVDADNIQSIMSDIVSSTVDLYTYELSSVLSVSHSATKVCRSWSIIALPGGSSSPGRKIEVNLELTSFRPGQYTILSHADCGSRGHWRSVYCPCPTSFEHSPPREKTTVMGTGLLHIGTIIHLLNCSRQRTLVKKFSMMMSTFRSHLRILQRCSLVVLCLLHVYEQWVASRAGVCRSGGKITSCGLEIALTLGDCHAEWKDYDCTRYQILRRVMWASQKLELHKSWS